MQMGLLTSTGASGQLQELHDEPVQQSQEPELPQEVQVEATRAIRRSAMKIFFINNIFHDEKPSNL